MYCIKERLRGPRHSFNRQQIEYILTIICNKTFDTMNIIASNDLELIFRSYEIYKEMNVHLSTLEVNPDGYYYLCTIELSGD